MQPAGDDEIQRVRQHLPDAEVLGVLRDGKGLLIELDAGSAAQLARCEDRLLRAGATEWSWTLEPSGTRVRAYWTPRPRWPFALAAAVLATTAYLCYDVHAAQNVAGWAAALQRSTGLPL